MLIGITEITGACKTNPCAEELYIRLPASRHGWRPQRDSRLVTLETFKVSGDQTVVQPRDPARLQIGTRGDLGLRPGSIELARVTPEEVAAVLRANVGKRVREIWHRYVVRGQRRTLHGLL